MAQRRERYKVRYFCGHERSFEITSSVTTAWAIEGQRRRCAHVWCPSCAERQSSANAEEPRYEIS